MIRKIADGRMAPAPGEVRAALPDTPQLSVSLLVAAVALTVASCFGMNFGMELTPRCCYDLCSAAIISRAATGRVGSRKFKLPL